jgi:actin-related protein
LAGTIKTQVVAAFTTLRGAMMATGIGLITSAVAFLVTNFDAVKNKLGELFPALKGAGDLMDRLKQIAMGVGNAIMQFLAAPISAIVKAVQGDFKGAFDALKNGVAFTKNFRAGEQKEIKDQADERERLRQEELKKEQEANKKKLEEQKRAAAERLRKLQEQQEKERQLRDAADKVLREVELKGLTERQRQEATLLDEFNKNKAVLIAAGITNFLDLETQYRRDLTAIGVKFETEEAERVKKLQEEKLAKDKARQEADINNKLSEFARIKNVTSDFNKAQVDAEIALQDAKFEAASAGLNALATLAQGNEKIANIFFAIDKALAIGKIIVDAQREISANMLYGASHPMNAIVPGSGVALGAKLSLITKIRAAASIATIVATTIAKFKSGGGASVPNPSGGGGGGINTTAPLAPQLTPQVTATAVNTAAVNQMGNQATRAYVLNSDIQNNDQRNAYIDRNASIG